MFPAVVYIFSYYSDNSFSLISLLISDEALVDRIIVMLNEIRGLVSHPEIDKVLKGLAKAKSGITVLHYYSFRNILGERQEESHFGPMTFKTVREPKKLVLKPRWGDVYSHDQY